ncbi:MAG TPA: heme exporter protein CcmD [Caulobacteraceae bacterium]|nr:heme exporter protein CcmD [Caulobacteraceae bacterium]
MIDFSNRYFIYVWPPIAITAVVLAWTLVDSLLRARRWKARVEAEEREAGA